MRKTTASMELQSMDESEYSRETREDQAENWMWDIYIGGEHVRSV